MKPFDRFCGKSWQKLTWSSWLAVALAAVGGIAFGRTFLGSVSVVDGPSMAPTYPPGTHLLTLPILTPLQRGDVVLVDDGDQQYAVKRIVGLPGETVHLWRGQLFINREMLLEPYLPKNTFTCPVRGRKVGASFTLGQGHYFVLGDNRSCSTDSRSYGAVQAHQLKRRVPLPGGFLRARLAHYTLPTPETPLIHPL